MRISLHKDLRVMGLGTYRLKGDLLNHRTMLCLMALAFFLVLAGGILSAKNVVLTVNGESFNVRVYGKTVQAALDKAEIKLNPGDIVRPGRSSRIYDGSVVVVAGEKRITIFDGNSKISAAMTMPSVAEILSAQGITLGRDDLVEARFLPGHPYIRITRQSIQILTERKEIAFCVERVIDKELSPFESKVVQKGAKGILENKIQVVVRNGKETQRKIIAARTIKEPRKELIRYAEAIISRGSSSYRPVKNLTMKVTAYTHSGNCTATGTWPALGTVAVDPKVIPLGTPMYIQGYGFGVARDTGGSIKGSRLDVFFENKKNALKWGKKTVQVRILRKIN